MDKQISKRAEAGTLSEKQITQLGLDIENNKFDYSAAIKKMCQGIFTINVINCPKQIFVMAIL